MYNNNDLEHFKQLLQRQGAEIGHTIELMKENKDAEQDKYSPTELSNYDNHPAEMGSQLFEAELNTALRVHEEHLLKDIQDALGRIENGTFGRCAFCGGEIDRERLEVLPYARLCIKCEEEKKVSPKMIRKTRPNEEKVIDAPMGRKYLNQREDDEFEGLDQFNDLMKYGSSDSPQDLGGYYDYEDYYTNEIDEQGIVDDMDRVSNQEYKKQLPR